MQSSIQSTSDSSSESSSSESSSTGESSMSFETAQKMLKPPERTPTETNTKLKKLSKKCIFAPKTQVDFDLREKLNLTKSLSNLKHIKVRGDLQTQSTSLSNDAEASSHEVEGKILKKPNMDDSVDEFLRDLGLNSYS